MTAKLIIGHGAEKTQPFEARKRIPPGYTLVTYAQCGSVTYSSTVVELVKAFGNPVNKEILENPLANPLALKSALNGLDTHIYTEGMYYPEATIYLFAYWLEAKEIKDVQKDNQIAISKSGVYNFPLNMDTWTLQPGLDYSEKSMFTTLDLTKSRKGFNPSIQFTSAEELVTKSYSDSIFPTPEEATLIANRVGNKLDSFVEATKYSLETIFEKGGPGVYYHFVCREPVDIGLNYYMKSFGENIEVPNYNYNKHYSINTIPNLLPFMQSYANKRQVQFEQKLKAFMKEKNPDITDEEVSVIAANLRNNPSVKDKYGLSNVAARSLFSWNYQHIVNAPKKFKNAHNMIHNTRRKSIAQQTRGNKTRRRKRKTA